jgi:hypothetical protein
MSPFPPYVILLKLTDKIPFYIVNKKRNIYLGHLEEKFFIISWSKDSLEESTGTGHAVPRLL